MIAIKSGDISRTHRERLLKAGFIKVDDRRAYMAAFEAASVQEDVAPFARFLAGAGDMGR